MGRLTLPLRALAVVAVFGAVAATPVLAQTMTPPPTQAVAACDGQTFAGQLADTQNQFIATFGANAATVWAQQHNAAVVAAGGCPPPAPPMAAVPPPAPVVIVERSDNGNGNDNDNDDHRPSVSLDVSRGEVGRNESFEIRVRAERERANRISKIWWWATDTDDRNLRDTHTHDCDDSDTCRNDWQESTDDGGRTIRIHAVARDRNGRDSDEVTRDIRVR